MMVADEDMPDLPPLNVVVSRIELPPAVMATYKTMQRELFAAVEGRAIEAASAMVATGKLRAARQWLPLRRGRRRSGSRSMS